jgi:hypothetical protein
VADHTTADGQTVRVTREIPLPWLVTIAAGLVAQGVTLWTGQQAQGAAIKDLIAEVREMRQAVNAATIVSAEHTMRFADIERRLNALEQRR